MTRSWVRILIRELLEERGYRVLEAGDGMAGLEVLRSDARVDLLVSDIGTPCGLNGRQM
jgi:CheY-like chemotaxis protein